MLFRSGKKVAQLYIRPGEVRIGTLREFIYNYFGDAIEKLARERKEELKRRQYEAWLLFRPYFWPHSGYYYHCRYHYGYHPYWYNCPYGYGFYGPKRSGFHIGVGFH